MRVFLTGATGLIGRALVPALQRDGHTVVAWVRSASRARHLVGADTELCQARDDDAVLAAAVRGADAVIHLAGEPFAGRRWTPARRRAFADSRVGLAGRIVRAMAPSSPRPPALISASAIGGYGDRGDEILTEQHALDGSAGGSLAAQWEAAALDATALGVQVTILRIGLVLAREGGLLSAIQPIYRLGLGGPFGSGRQYLSWIHLHDLVRILTTAVADDRYHGIVNAVAPAPVTHRALAAALGRALRRPGMVRVPAVVLRTALGGAARALVEGQRARPARLEALGFTWQWPSLEGALADLTTSAPIAIRRIDAAWPRTAPDHPYLRRRRPRFELVAATTVEAPLAETFAFFGSARNLGLITPRAMRFEITAEPAAMAEGETIGYRLRVRGLPVRWRTRIAAWTPPRRFVDVQESGPYRSWWHEHTFRAAGAHTIVEDRVWYAPPFGPIGRIANRLFIVPALRRIFTYRRDVIALRFGPSADHQR